MPRGGLGILRLGQGQGVQDFIHPLHPADDLHAAAGDIHYFHHDIGNGGNKDQIEDKGGREALVIGGIHPDPDSGRDQKQVNVVDDGGKGRHIVFPAQGIGNHHVGIFLDGVMHTAEGIHGLLEGFDHGNAPDILHRRVVHVLQRGLISFHPGFGALVAVGFYLHRKGDDDAHQGRQAEAPVNRQQNNQHDRRRYQGSHDVRKLMGDESFDLLNVLIHDFAQLAAAHQHVKTQRHSGQMGGEIYLQLVQGAEGGQMGAHQGEKV